MQYGKLLFLLFLGLGLLGCSSSPEKTGGESESVKKEKSTSESSKKSDKEMELVVMEIEGMT